MTRIFEFPLDCFVAIELPVHDNPRPLVLTRDRLITSRQVDDAESRVPKANPAVGGNPVPLPVGTTMIEGLCSTLHYCRRYWITTRKESDDSAHADMHPLNSISDIDVPGFGAEGEPYVPRL